MAIAVNPEVSGGDSGGAQWSASTGTALHDWRRATAGGMINHKGNS